MPPTGPSLAASVIGHGGVRGCTVSEPAAGAAGLRFAPGVIHRASKRGLVIANRHGETVLFEHPRAAGLPMLLAVTPTPDELARRLGPPLEPGVISDLLAAEFLIEASDSLVAAAPARPPAVTLSRSGLMLAGIAGPARWLDRYLAPVVTSRPGRYLLLLMVAAGARLPGGRAAGPAQRGKSHRRGAAAAGPRPAHQSHP